MFCDNRVKFFFQLLDFAGSNFNVRGLALGTAHRLVDHYAAVCEGGALAFLTGHEQDGSHRCGHARTDGGDVAADELHRVVDAQPGID